MWSYCENPSELEGLTWLSCYLTTNIHFSFYWSFLTVLTLLAITAPLALVFGFGGALAKRSSFAALRWFGAIYTNMVRGIPDIIFFLFVPIALDQAFEFVRYKLLCDDSSAYLYVETPLPGRCSKRCWDRWDLPTLCSHRPRSRDQSKGISRDQDGPDQIQWAVRKPWHHPVLQRKSCTESSGRFQCRKTHLSGYC